MASLRLHVDAHEDLSVDALRALARDGVTLWLRTRSALLRESTLELLGRFDGAFVELRGPLTSLEVQGFARRPAVGLFGELEAVRAARPRLPGVRRLALHLARPTLSEADAAEIRALRPELVRWAPPDGAVDLLSWARFRQLPGRRLFALPTSAVRPFACGAAQPREPAAAVDVATLLAAAGDVHPCGPGRRVTVRPDAEPWLLQSLLARDPSVELILEIGADPVAAARTAAMLDALGLRRR